MSNFPDDNKGKMNLYAESFSRAVGMNLSRFCKSWGWPIEEATEEALSHLPPWTDHPMAQYSWRSASCWLEVQSFGDLTLEFN